MTEANKKPHPEGPPISGPELAMEMVTQLARMNLNLEAQLKLDTSKLALMDELNGRLETVTRACQIISELKGEGKIKIGFLEFSEAMAQADEEIMGDEEDDDEEDDDDGTIPMRPRP